MKNLKLIIVICLISMGCISCMSSKSLYTWHNYEDASYVYTKKQTDKTLDKLIKEYKYIISHQKGIRKAVPPGIYAEYAYLLIKMNNKEEGIMMLRKEVELYPESKIFIGRIIKQLEK